MRQLHYILDANHQPVPFIGTVVEWAIWFSKEENRALIRTELDGGEVRISTIFLGIDHNYSGIGAPILFETMVFGGEMDMYQQRYATYEDAILGHDEVRTKVEATLK